MDRVVITVCTKFDCSLVLDRFVDRLEVQNTADPAIGVDMGPLMASPPLYGIPRAQFEVIGPVFNQLATISLK